MQSEVVPTVGSPLYPPSMRLTAATRVLDPILFDLLDPSVRRSRSVTKVNTRELQDFTYDAPMDQRLINHLLDTLLSVVRFGGQGFVKVANSTPIRRSLHLGLVKRVESCTWTVVRPPPVGADKFTSWIGSRRWYLPRRGAGYLDTVRPTKICEVSSLLTAVDFYSPNQTTRGSRQCASSTQPPSRYPSTSSKPSPLVGRSTRPLLRRSNQ